MLPAYQRMLKKILPYTFLAVAICSCENDMQAIMQLDQKKAAVEEGIDIETIFSQQGKVRSKLMAPKMDRHLSTPPYVEFNDGLRVLIYNDTLGIESTVTAKYGKYMENEGNVFLKDSVVVINKQGKRLDCNELNWDAKKEIFYTYKPVKISTPTDTIRGAAGMESNQDFSDYKILSVSGPVTMEDSTTTNNNPPADSTVTP
jgi:LPS export ABC transporter protein LptC